MTLRSLLLAGTVLPFAIAVPALAETPTRSNALRLAQVEVVCPEGEVCPPVEGAEPGLEGAQPEQQPEQIEPAPEAAPDAVPPEEVTPVPEEVIIEEAPPPLPEETPPDEGQPEQIEPLPEVEPAPLPEEIPPPGEAEPQPDLEPAPLPEEAPPPGDIQPQPDVEQVPLPEEAPPPGEIAPQPEAEATPAPETTVEQQLEAQGDQEEAGRVRTLRDQLLRQFEQVIAPDGSQQNRRSRRGMRSYDQGNVVEERGDSVIIDLGDGNVYVQPVVPDDADRLLYGTRDVQVQELEGGNTRTILTRGDGVKIITARDRNGNILRRVKRLPDGRDIVLIDNRYREGYEFGEPPILYDVPPPRIIIPEDQYIVDLGRADYDDIRGALLAPPVQELQRPYTLDEVLRNEQVRAYSPRIDLDTITFEFGSSTIGNDQMRSLYYLGQAMQDVLAERPDEVYLIEGHTDAVGSNYDNLILSDRRASAVAVALSQNFAIPPENLITQGYGEEYLKIPTEGPDRRNRRATVRRVTELLQAQQQQ